MKVFESVSTIFIMYGLMHYSWMPLIIFSPQSGLVNFVSVWLVGLSALFYFLLGIRFMQLEEDYDEE